MDRKAERQVLELIDTGEFDRAIQLAEPLAELGEASGLGLLGTAYFMRGASETDLNIAKRLLAEAAALGDPAAAHNLATLYAVGTYETPPNANMARSFRRLSQRIAKGTDVRPIWPDVPYEKQRTGPESELHGPCATDGGSDESWPMSLRLAIDGDEVAVASFHESDVVSLSVSWAGGPASRSVGLRVPMQHAIRVVLDVLSDKQRVVLLERELPLDAGLAIWVQILWNDGSFV